MADETKDPLINARDNPEWWNDRNARRRERYAKDKAYQVQRRAMSRENYREGKKSVGTFDPRQNLANIDQFGAVRKVQDAAGNVTERWCLTRREMAALLGRNLNLFYLWTRDGRFPPAVLMAIDYSTQRDYKDKQGNVVKTGVVVPHPVECYTSEEAIAAVNALGPHLAYVAYYRHDHDDAKRKVAEAVAAARATLNIQTKGDD